MIETRPGRREDTPVIVDFQVRMARETEGIDLHPPTVEEGVEAVFDDPRKGAYWIAESEGETAGCLLTVPEWSDWRNGTVLWVHSVYVIPSARRRGVFREMYRALKAMVEASPDLRGIRLYVATENAGAQETYRVMGMDDGRYHMFEWMKEGE
ncbi:MAG: GNAT family N-acetyltransferase [Gammaproteobacteria bacterium]|nr:GNAT family N-acetyltransferase [Gammaproteobacteria bacterium]MDE0226949.1 GNAT family N-acetyltransferase [Gammaproteobacteria bacterium]